jgi:protein arginine kinase activator
MKCQTCPKLATYHITEVLGEDRTEELHLCEECFRRSTGEGLEAAAATPAKIPAVDDDIADVAHKHCDACGIKFAEFRNSGRLGCPHDYDSFRSELVPLLENIHAETKHAGKRPRRLPKAKADLHTLADLRRQLQTAVTNEEYETAAGLRDTIRKLEEAAA